MFDVNQKNVLLSFSLKAQRDAICKKIIFSIETRHNGMSPLKIRGVSFNLTEDSRRISETLVHHLLECMIT